MACSHRWRYSRGEYSPVRRWPRQLCWLYRTLFPVLSVLTAQGMPVRGVCPCCVWLPLTLSCDACATFCPVEEQNNITFIHCRGEVI